MALNKNDYLLLEFCRSVPRSITEISKELDIAIKNVSKRLTKLRESKLIEENPGGKGKPTLIKSIDNNPAIRDGKILMQVLKKQNDNKKIPSLDWMDEEFKPEDFDTEEVLKYLQAKKRVGFIITDQGKQFLKENKK